MLGGRRRRIAARVDAAGAVDLRRPTGLERVIADAVAARAGGSPMTPDELPIVVACRDLIANTIGQLPMIAYRGNTPRPDQPPVIVRPDPFEPRWQTLHRLTNNLTGWGHAWLIPTASYANDYPAAVQVVDASRAFATFDPSGRITDVYHDGRRLDPGGPNGAILIPWRVPQAGSLGRAPLADCWRAAEYLAALYDMAGSFWEAGFPSMAVLVKQALNPTQTRELKDQVLGAWSRRHEPAIVDRDGQLAQIGTSAVESQLVESIAVANTEIARAFGVMPSLVNVAAGDSLTYATTEAEFSKWLKVGLGQYLSRIEAAFSDLTPYGTDVRFDTTELLRTDLEARWNAYAIGVQNGWILPAEVREREGFPPLPAAAGALPAPAASSNMLADPPQSAHLGRSDMHTDRQTVVRAAVLEAGAHVGIARRAAVVDGDDAARTIRVCLVPWGEVARVTDDGRSFYDESWTTGSLSPADTVAVFDGHRPTPNGVERGPLIGRAGDLEDLTDGLYATLSLADTTAGRDAYALARTMGAVHVSIEADVTGGAADGGAIVRSATDPGILTGVAICWPPSRGAFPGAVGAARAATTPTEPDVPPADPDTPDPDAPDTISRAEVADLVRTAVARFGLVRAVGATMSPLARYESFDELHQAVRSASRDEAAVLSRQFADAYTAHRTAVARVWQNQITSDNPGVMPPGWLTDVFGIVDAGRPSITALGGPRSPGDSGMDVNWPYYDGDLTTIVGEQVAQKTEIVSVKVSFKRGTATLKTYAGGSDVAYQLQRRSSPSYMALYDRILQIAYGITTENAFVDALVAGAGHSLVLVVGTATDQDIRRFLFQASAHVRTVTGAPASVVLVSSDVFLAWGSIGDLVAPQYGTQNVSGTSSASTLAINVSGLTITEAPMAPPGTVLVTNQQAAAWLEEGPFLASSEDVQKLGTDVAIWGMGAPGLFLPAGITKAVAAAGDDAAATSSKSSKSS